ncbi:MAG: FecR family protein [Methylococcaceae bacterium]|nr:FecR family protein [Methylococcaceae bacterium]
MAWFARLQDSKATQGDRAEFAEWLSTSPQHQAAYDKVVRLWQSPALNEALSHYAATPLHPVRRRFSNQRWAAAAACLLLTGSWLMTASGWLTRWQADIATNTGQQRRELLADGSAITLNTDTAVKLDYNGRGRGVRLLRGEAYFEVQPDKNKPFIVSTEQGTVRVVGTHFTVKSGDTTQVDVESGIVVCAARQGESRQLRVGQHTSIDKSGVATATNVDGNQAFAWLKGRLIFQDQTLADVIAEIDRYHPGAIVITDARLGQTRITGNYKLDDTAAIVRGLASVAGAKVIQLSPYLTVLKS